MFTTTRIFKSSALLVALLFGALLVQGAGAEPYVGASHLSAERLAKIKSQDCLDYGGTPTTDYDMNSDGSVNEITVSCKGGSADQRTCTYTQGATQTFIYCALIPGEQSTDPHAPIGNGSLENIEVTPAPTHGGIGGGTLSTPEAGPTRSTVVTGAFQSTTAQADNDED